MNLLFIGAVNLGNFPKGGEEYKNQLLHKKIKDYYTNAAIIDTYNWIRKPRIWLKLMISILIKDWDSVLISASSESTYKLLALIGKYRPMLLPKITYLVIGGYFPKGICDGRFEWKVYRNLKNVIVQGNQLKNTLENYTNLLNIFVLPNFKDFPHNNFYKIENNNTIFNFVFVGRISDGKGVNEILKAIKILEEKNVKFRVDFFGPIVDNFKLDSDVSGYCGFLDFQGNPEQSYERLAQYDCLLFPSYWKGEGFPGVIIDAFVAGLPVIATEWNMNLELIEDNVNGFIIEPKNAKALADKMNWVMENKDVLKPISENNRKKAKKYHIDEVWPNLVAHVVS